MRRKYSVTVAVLAVIALIPAGAVLDRAGAAREARWYQYRFDGRRQGFNPNETQITPANVGSLARRKVVRFPFSGPTPPVVFQDTLYMFALSLVGFILFLPLLPAGQPADIAVERLELQVERRGDLP